MSHELTIRANGKAEMAYTGAAAWHGLGQALAAGASIAEWQKAAGMDWTILSAMLEYAFTDPTGARQAFTFPGRVALHRSDTGAPLGIVSPEYHPVQPADVLEFFRDVVADGVATLETAGTLFGGRKFWALAKMAETVIGPRDVTDPDRVGGYVLLVTSCDGTMQTEARKTSVRVVCRNTLALARAVKDRSVIRVGHREQWTQARAAKVRRDLGLAREEFEAFASVADTLARVKVTDAAAQDYVRRLLRPTESVREDAAKAAAIVAESAPGASADFAALMQRAATLTAPESAAPVKAARAPRGEADILRLFHSDARGGTMASADGTAWGLVNAVTEWADHHKQAASDAHRMDSAFFGDADELKTRAFELAQTSFA